MVSQEFGEIFRDYLGYYAQKTTKKEHQMHVLLTKFLPEEIRVKGNIGKRYLVDGSDGSGNINEVPWIAIFDTGITKTATKGYYIVYLFDAEMNGVYLSLNQGWTQYKNKWEKTKNGSKLAREEISTNARKFQELLKSTLEDFNFDRINLHPKHDNGEGYQLGHICGKYYPKSNMPSDEKMMEDLNNLIGVYRELKGYVGKDIFKINEIQINEDEEKYYEVSNEVSPLDLPEGPLEKPVQVQRKGGVFYNRDPKISAKAIQTASHLCEIDPTHKTFTQKTTKKSYVEPHHLVPIENQGAFEVSIDVPENIVALCPNCHKAVHYAVDEEKKMILEELFEKRKIRLESRGITISIFELEKLYNIT